MASCPSLYAQKGDTFDDMMQHFPMATVFALKAGGLDSQTASWPELMATAGATYIIGAGTAYGLKHTMNEWRPDDSDRNSFPSGHAMFAFAGATTLHHEYGHVSPWVSVSGFGVAALVAADRVRRDRHYIHDVCAGAAIGVLSAELTYFLKRKYLKSKEVSVGFNGQSVNLVARW